MSDMVPFHSRKGRNSYLLVLGKYKRSHTNLYFILWLIITKLTCCTENSADPDDRSAGFFTSWSGSRRFTIEFIPGFILFSKEFIYCFSIVRNKLICSLGQVKFLWTRTLWPFTCPWASIKFYYFHTFYLAYKQMFYWHSIIDWPILAICHYLHGWKFS